MRDRFSKALRGIKSKLSVVLNKLAKYEIEINMIGTIVLLVLLVQAYCSEMSKMGDRIRTDEAVGVKPFELQIGPMGDRINNNIGYRSNKIFTYRIIETDKDILSKMAKEANKLIKQSDDIKSNMENIKYEVIAMDSFISVDAEEEQIIENERAKKEKWFTICDEIYGNSGYIGKYMNESGEAKVVMAEYLDDKINTYDREKYINRSDWSTELSEYKLGDMLSEREYVNRIVNYITNINSEDTEIESMFMGTASTEIKAMRLLINENGENNRIGFVTFGKSNIENEDIDRLYVQVESIKENEITYTDLEFKINNDGLVFDIDIL